MPISISKTGAKLVKISGKHVFDAHFLTSFCCHFVRKRDKVSNICGHLTAKDFSIDDVNATLAEQAAKLQLTADETELVDSIVMLYGSKSQNGFIFLTHAEQHWVEAREGLHPTSGRKRKSPLDTMHDYYKARHERNKQKRCQTNHARSGREHDSLSLRFL